MQSFPIQNRNIVYPLENSPTLLEYHARQLRESACLQPKNAADFSNLLELIETCVASVAPSFQPIYTQALIRYVCAFSPSMQAWMEALLVCRQEMGEEVRAILTTQIYPLFGDDRGFAPHPALLHLSDADLTLDEKKQLLINLCSIPADPLLDLYTAFLELLDNNDYLDFIPYVSLLIPLATFNNRFDLDIAVDLLEEILDFSKEIRSSLFNAIVNILTQKDETNRKICISLIINIIIDMKHLNISFPLTVFDALANSSSTTTDHGPVDTQDLVASAHTICTVFASLGDTNIANLCLHLHRIPAPARKHFIQQVNLIDQKVQEVFEAKVMTRLPAHVSNQKRLQYLSIARAYAKSPSWRANALLYHYWIDQNLPQGLHLSQFPPLHTKTAYDALKAGLSLYDNLTSPYCTRLAEIVTTHTELLTYLEILPEEERGEMLYCLTLLCLVEELPTLSRLNQYVSYLSPLRSEHRGKMALFLRNYCPHPEERFKVFATITQSMNPVEIRLQYVQDAYYEWSRYRHTSFLDYLVETIT